MKDFIHSPSFKIFIALFIITLSLQSLPNNIYTQLQFNTHTFKQNFYYMMFTPHLLHLDWMHFVMNISALFLCLFYFYQVYTYINFLTVFLISSICISVGMFLFSPHIEYYVGLSGVLHALFIFGAILSIKQNKFVSIFIISLILIKIIQEQFFNQSLNILFDGAVAFDSHMYGAITALFLAILNYLFI